MTTTLSLIDLQRRIVERSARYRTFDDIQEQRRYMAFALAGEVGVVCNKVKKQWRGDNLSANYFDDLISEVGDCFIYWVLLCEAYDYHIEVVMINADAKAERHVAKREAAFAEAKKAQRPNGMQTQRAEFGAVETLIEAYQRLPAVVDDDYPRLRRSYETAIRILQEAIKANRG